MNSSLRRASLPTLLAFALGIGCYGANPTDTVVQESALCGEDLLLPTNYTCTRALTNIGTSGVFEGQEAASTDGRAAPEAGECRIYCDCRWERISDPASCGSNRLADGASVPTCADHSESRHLLTVLPGVADGVTCTDLGRRPNTTCAEVCKLSVTNPLALSQAPTAMEALQRLSEAGTPVVVPNGQPILDERTEVMYCCAPNPLRRSAPRTESSDVSPRSSVTTVRPEP